MVNGPLEIARKRMNRRAPDGVTIIAPFEQADITEYPGISTGVEPSAMMLFDVRNDPGEQVDLADKNPRVVKRLKGLFDRMKTQVPSFPASETESLFTKEAQKNGELMRLIGGELRYDKIPNSQKHLLRK